MSSERKRLSTLSLILLLTIVTACGTTISSRPLVKEYSKAEQDALFKELEEKCPLTHDKFGNEVHSCPMIDKAISNYKDLRDKLRVK